MSYPGIMLEGKSVGTGGRWLFVGAAAIVVLAGLKASQTLVIPFLLALLLAIICAPAVAWLTRRRVPVVVSVLIVVVVLLLVFSGFGAVVGSSVDDFAAFASKYQNRFDGVMASMASWFEGHDIDPESLDLLNSLKPGKLINMLGGVLKNLAAVLSNLFLIILTMIFMLFEAASFPAKLRLAVDNSSKFNIDNIGQIIRQVQHYLGIKTVTSVATGVLIGLWTAILGLEFAVVWGLLAFLLNYIPSIGSIVAAFPAVLLALVQEGVGYAVIVAAGYIVVNVAIGNFIEPYLMGRTLGLSTLIVFLSLVFWGWMWGSIGMLLSVPLTMIIKIFLENTDDLKWVAIMLDNRRSAEKRLEEAAVAAPPSNDA